MAYFADLTRCDYSGCRGFLAVGWLDKAHDFPKGEVEPDLVDILARLWGNRNPNMSHRGWHNCEFCGEATSSHCIAVGGYVSPAMIIHYIQDHGYKPPDEFLQALREVKS
jgi:hypothetical protein